MKAPAATDDQSRAALPLSPWYLEHPRRAARFVQRGIWQIESARLPRAKALWLKIARVLVLSTFKFVEDKCLLRATALTLYLLLSLVPLVALAFAISKGFGMDQLLQDKLLELELQKEVVAHITVFARNLLDKTSGGVVAGVGIIFLLWSVVQVLGNIEESFNDIWGISKSRGFGRKCTDYSSVVILCPLLLIVSSSVTVLINQQVQFMAEHIQLLGMVAPLIMRALRFSTYLIIWILFTFLYLFIPNTRVRWTTGIIAGIVAGTIFQLGQFGYVTFQIGVARYNAIYAGFAALPLFIIWLQMSWMIVLYGAEFACAWQNVQKYEFLDESLRASAATRGRMALIIMRAIVARFTQGAAPFSLPELQATLALPLRLLQQELDALVACGVLAETRAADPAVITYQPARDTALLSIDNVLSALEHYGTQDVPHAPTADAAAVTAALSELSAARTQSPANRLIRDL